MGVSYIINKLGIHLNGISHYELIKAEKREAVDAFFGFKFSLETYMPTYEMSMYSDRCLRNGNVSLLIGYFLDI